MFDLIAVYRRDQIEVRYAMIMNLIHLGTFYGMILQLSLTGSFGGTGAWVSLADTPEPTANSLIDSCLTASHPMAVILPAILAQ